MAKIPEVILNKIQEAEKKQLKELDLSMRMLTEIPAEVFELKHLEKLFLSGNLITSIPETISNLRNLTFLNLSNNKLVDLPESLINLKKLTEIFLRSNEWTSVPEVISRLKKLKHIDLSNNRLSHVPNWISLLQDLQILNLEGNELNSLPDEIAQLRNLRILDLAGNLFREIPDIVYNLVNLKYINFANHYAFSRQQNQIKNISSKILRLEKLETLHIDNNPVENPPPEVVERGLDAIKDYFRQLEKAGQDFLYEAKLLIIGEPGAGKTTLAKKIKDSGYKLQEEEKSNEGIEVIQWHFPMKDGQQFRVNIWDFGGQEIYHATHQFFLTKRSLYILVADTRKEDTDFHYWLNVVELLSDNSPLLIIKNEKQDRHRDINERQLRGQFTNLKETRPTNLANNRGFPEILNDIKHYISNLPHIGTPLPSTWVKVREALENDDRNYISLEGYLDICEQNGFTEQKNKFQLSGYLHDLGVCLHFQDDPLLKKTVILKPKWGTDAVYKVLDNKTVISKLGKFNRADLTSIWHEPEYTNMQDELLQLMINFKLCYKIPNTKLYIAPQLLSENQPHYDWDETSNLILRYTYEFMPKGIITQFIVAMHTLIDNQKYVWKSGVILKRDETKAEVIEYYGKREIKIRVAGKYKKELLAIIGYELEKIHSSYNRLRYSILIPCNCSVCKNSQQPHFYSFGVLRNFINAGQSEIQCQHGYGMVDVRGLIDDVIEKRQPLEEANTLSPFGERERAGFIFHGPVDKVVVQRVDQGDNIMKDQGRDKIAPRSAWANGSFYLFVFAVVIAGLGILAKSIPIYALPLILIAGILFVPIIGALQLRQDDRLSEKRFSELMKMTIEQLPLIGKTARRTELGE